MAVLTLYIRLLGEFRLLYDDQHVTSLTTPRLQSLFAYLVLHRDVPQQRQHLAFLFWPDTSEAQARNNLRQLLHQLRQAFPAVEQYLQVGTSSVSWRLEAVVRLDVAAFEQALARASEAERRHDSHAQQASLSEADRLYRGALVPSCYDDWIVPERERLRQAHQQALQHLLQLGEEQGDHTTAIGYARRLLQLDPLSEDLARRLMRLHVKQHDRASALRVYHTTAATLQRELGVEPDPATRAAYEQLMQQDRTVPSASEPPIFSISSTLIGRERECGELHSAWQRTKDDGPHLVLIKGEAGIGKSRLAEDFLELANQQGAITATARCYAAEGQLALLPVTEWLRSSMLRAHLERLEPVWLAEVARLLPELLTEGTDVPHYAPITDFGQRHRFFEALARAILVTQQPLLLVIDDLQWCDADTLEWLHLLLRFDHEARLLVIGCARSEELPPEHPLHNLLLHLSPTTGVTELALAPLDAAETAKLAEQLSKRELDDESVMYVYHETEGVPLFVVELLRAEQGQALERQPASEEPLRRLVEATRALPARVQAVLSGRLRQLSPEARACASLAATIGREFRFDLLLAAGSADADSTVRALDELWHKRIVREQGATGYDFTHDKLREVAYQEQSVPQRRQQHRRVAAALERLHADDLDAVSGQIATHYERAGLLEQALPYYLRAAAVARRLYANEEAIGLLSRGLEVLKELPPGVKRDQQELRLQMAMMPLYRVAKGWASPELGSLLVRIQALCDAVGDNNQRAVALYGLQSLYCIQARFAQVLSVTDELNALYQKAYGIAPPFGQAMVGGVYMCMGRFREAQALGEEILAADVPEFFLNLQAAQGVDYTALTQENYAHLLWCLGYPEQALKRVFEADRLVQNSPQPINRVLVATYLAMLQQLRADEATARTCAEDALALADQYQAPHYHSWATILVSYAEAREKPDEPHIARMRAVIDDFIATSARLRLPYYRALLAHIYLQGGQAEEGLAVIDEALVGAEAHQEHWWDAELYRLRGELLRRKGASSEAVEAALLRAIEIAQAQQAKSFELRATMSLARLWSAHSRSAEARQRLSTVYIWFTEGFDTPDLQAARLLLARL